MSDFDSLKQSIIDFAKDNPDLREKLIKGNRNSDRLNIDFQNLLSLSNLLLMDPQKKSVVRNLRQNFMIDEEEAEKFAEYLLEGGSSKRPKKSYHQI